MFTVLDREKTAYRKLVAELSEEKKVYEHFQNILRGVSAKLTSDFESWWSLRKWQLTGSQGRSDSIVAFSDKKFAERSTELSRGMSEVKTINQTLTQPDPVVQKYPSATHQQINRPRGAAPDHEVQSELQKLFQARDRLKDINQGPASLPG